MAAYERRYPNSGPGRGFPSTARGLSADAGAGGPCSGSSQGLGAVVAALAGYDAWGYRDAVAFEADHPATLVEARWKGLLNWHPTLPYFWPDRARQAQEKLADWQVKAAADRVAAGTADEAMSGQLRTIKEQRPALAPAIERVEKSHEEARHDARWREVKADAVASSDKPDAIDLALRGFLREFPESPKRTEAEALIEANKARAAERRSLLERRVIDDLVRSATLPNADLVDLIDQARGFLKDSPREPPPRPRSNGCSRGSSRRSTTVSSIVPRPSLATTRPTTWRGSRSIRTISSRTNRGASTRARPERPRPASFVNGTTIPTGSPTTSWPPTPTTSRAWPRGSANYLQQHPGRPPPRRGTGVSGLGGIR